MFLTRKRAFARAGLLGNPSDGYHGKTISVSVRNYWAEGVLYEWDTVEIVLADDDRAKFDSVYELARDVRLHGYYGGIRLIKATIKRFVDHCLERGLPLHDFLDQIEREAITKALEATRFNKTAAAKLLGITFRSLRYRLDRLGID